MNLVQKYKRDIKDVADQVQKELPIMTGKEGALARSAMNQAVNEVEDDMEEQTSAGSAGAFVAPMGWNNDTGMSKPQNEEEIDEVTGTSSAGAFVSPWGWTNGISAHQHHVHDYPNQDFLVKAMNEEQELDETDASNSGAYSQPAIWAKNYKNWKAVQDPKFPKYGGPGAKYVRVKEKCRHFPYCNQGDINALEFYEDKNLNEAIENVSKKTNKSKGYLKNLVLKEMESMFKKDLRKLKNKRMRGEISEEELEEIIRRGFYHSPITSLVGNMKMNKPTGKMYSMKGNKPKYE